MERKRLLWAYGVVTVLVVAFIMILLLAVGRGSKQPVAEPVDINVSGTLACLPHKNVTPGQPQTLECAIGLRTDDGRYYGLKDMSSQDSQTSFNTRVYVSGKVTPPSTDDRYDTVGDVSVTKFTASAKQ